MNGLTPTGKPMRALRALENTTRDDAMSEEEVWMTARKNGFDTAAWHGPLASLVRHGYAQRIGRHGNYRWFITPQGRAVLKREP